MANALELPPGLPNQWAERLFLAIGEDVSPSRPLFTGDVFVGVEVDLPGAGKKARDLIVLTHPCSMRTGTSELVPRLLAAVVRGFKKLETTNWQGNFDKIPLPAVGNGSHGAANLQVMVVVESRLLDGAHRVACMDLFGVNFLMQRLVNYQTRVVVPTATLSEVVEGPFEEADLLEEWVEAVSANGVPALQAMQSANEWLRQEVGGVKRQDALADRQTRSRIRREARDHFRSLST